MREQISELFLWMIACMSVIGILAFTENGEQATKIKEQQAIISLLCEASPQCKEEMGK